MIIITGASKGIGRYLFSRFKDAGHKVIGTYNSTDIDIENDIKSYYKVDVSDYLQVQEWIQSLNEELNNVTLINCAGISYNSFAHKSDIEKWKNVISVNLIGSFNVIRCLLFIMREQRFGRIINFSSVVAKLPTPGISAYAASKAGIIGLTKSLAVENGACGVTVNTINLGYVELGMGVNDVPPAYREKIKQQIPLGRFCYPEEVYNTVKYMMETEYLNGVDLDINGGIL
jgi:NAD(P)-dependent dehydrogenase (short-subunit alcohol dehydrogenase family)